MPVWAVAQLTITDRAVYNRYQARFMDVMNRFKGRVLAADASWIDAAISILVSLWWFVAGGRQAATPAP